MRKQRACVKTKLEDTDSTAPYSMSTSDVLDVLNIQRLDLPAGAKKKKSTAPRPKQTGVSRELYNLLGANTPTLQLAPTLSFKERLHAIGKPLPWTWAAFENPARSDGLQLHHWVRGTGEDQPAYPFARYNTQLPIPELTPEDYAEFVAEDEKTVVAREDGEETELVAREETEPWGYDETAYLFELARDFDLKWPVIYDRWEFGDSSRLFVQLQAHFYQTAARIFHKQYVSSGSSDTYLKNVVDLLRQFDADKELSRKEYLDRLLLRLLAEVAEEELLVMEARKFEMLAKRLLTERHELLRLLDLPQLALTAQFQTLQGLSQLYNALMVSDKNKKRKGETTEEPAAKRQTPGLTLQQYLQAHVKKTEDSNLPVAQLIAKKLSPRDEELYGLLYQERIAPGVVLRSSRLHTFKLATQQRVVGVLNELHLPARPVMPTRRVCDKFDELTKAVGVLLETKRQADKLRAEVEVVEGAQE